MAEDLKTLFKKHPELEKRYFEGQARVAAENAQMLLYKEELKRIFLIFVMQSFSFTKKDNYYTHWIKGLYLSGAIHELLFRQDAVYVDEDNEIRSTEKLVSSWEGIFEDLFWEIKDSETQEYIYSEQSRPLGGFADYSQRALSLRGIYKHILMRANPFDRIEEFNLESESVIYSNWSPELHDELMSIYNDGKNDFHNFYKLFSDSDFFEMSYNAYKPKKPSATFKLLKKKSTILDEYFQKIEDEIELNKKQNNTGCLSIFLPIIFLFQFFR